MCHQEIIYIQMQRSDAPNPTITVSCAVFVQEAEGTAPKGLFAAKLKKNNPI